MMQLWELRRSGIADFTAQEKDVIHEGGNHEREIGKDPPGSAGTDRSLC